MYDNRAIIDGKKYVVCMNVKRNFEICIQIVCTTLLLTVIILTETQKHACYRQLSRCVAHLQSILNPFHV